MSAGNAKHSGGFTLIELLVTLAVAVILATVAVPSFQGMMASSRLASDYNEVLSGINYARSEAIKRRTPVQFEVSSNGRWQYEISVVNGDLLRVRSGRDGRTSMDPGAVTFNALGRTESCIPEGDCMFSITPTDSEIGSRNIQITTMGRVGRAPAKDSEESEE